MVLTFTQNIKCIESFTRLVRDLPAIREETKRTMNASESTFRLRRVHPLAKLTINNSIGLYYFPEVEILKKPSVTSAFESELPELPEKKNFPSTHLSSTFVISISPL